MQFSSDFATIQTWLEQTNEYLSIRKSDNNFPNGPVYDLRQELSRIKVDGTFFTESELFRLRKTLHSAAEICNFFNDDNSAKFPQLKSLADNLTPFPEILSLIDSVIDKFGNVKDNASPELMRLRKQMASISGSVNSIMQRLLARYKAEGVVDKDCNPAIRDGRLVIPVQPMHKRQVRGIVHDESATGKTFFIEPEEIVETNNRIREIEADIKREITRILISVADRIRPELPELLALHQIIGWFDFIRAKVIFAEETNASMPNIGDTQEIEWYNAVHPVLFLTLEKTGKKVVPLSIKLDKKTHILLISGPNAGGKSVCLKTVGIVQYMLQCGVLPPANDNSHFGIFNDFFIDIGDEQSIENELSTYSSHLANMNYFMRHGSEKSLILIDEFGGGTEPQIGGAIAQAILKSLNEKGVFAIITTHYQNLKTFAGETDGIVNGAMLYDRTKMQPLFQLSIGMPGSSFAIEIAKKIGLPADVVDYAKNLVGSDYVDMDKYLLDIARDKRYWQNKRQDIRVEKKKLEALTEKYEADIRQLLNDRKAILQEAKTEAKEILSKSNASIENAIHEIKKVQAEKEKTKKIRKELDELKLKLDDTSATPASEKATKLTEKLRKVQRYGKTKQQEQPAPKESLKIGDTVTIDGSNSVGEIIELKGSQAVVAVGIFKSSIPVEKLQKTMRKATSSQKKSFVSATTSDAIRNRQLHFKQELDVRGMRTDEALQAVSYFIDDALQFNIKQVRILHGTGYGILRQRIREYLDTVQGVASYRDEHVQFGGAGITVVSFE